MNTLPKSGICEYFAKPGICEYFAKKMEHLQRYYALTRGVNIPLDVIKDSHSQIAEIKQQYEMHCYGFKIFFIENVNKTYLSLFRNMKQYYLIDKAHTITPIQPIAIIKRLEDWPVINHFIEVPELGNAIYMDGFSRFGAPLCMLIYFNDTCQKIPDVQNLFKLGDYFIKIIVDYCGKTTVISSTGELLPFNTIEGKRLNGGYVFENDQMKITVRRDRTATFETFTGRNTKAAPRLAELSTE